MSTGWTKKGERHDQLGSEAYGGARDCGGSRAEHCDAVIRADPVVGQRAARRLRPQALRDGRGERPAAALPGGCLLIDADSGRGQITTIYPRRPAAMVDLRRLA